MIKRGQLWVRIPLRYLLRLVTGLHMADAREATADLASR